jgi:hypothetical protein
MMRGATWMAGSSPAMTAERLESSPHSLPILSTSSTVLPARARYTGSDQP